MPPLSIPTLAPGSRVQHEFLVCERADKKTPPVTRSSC
jgi:hypothetical protein